MIEGTLGRGAMGVVYRATDPVIGRPVALKTLAPEHPLAREKLESLRRHLLHEAASAGALNHPGVVAIHDVVDDDHTGQISVAMEHVEGETLKDRLAHPRLLSLATIASIVSQIAEVLDFAHARGVVHRDIKPANVILTPEGKVKITDFGIASLRGRELAHELDAMGTPSYLAPERILGLEADHRADIYSLGVLLYEMLTGQLPFHGESLAELVRNTVADEPTPPDTYRPDISAELRLVLARAMAKEPDERYQSAGALASELRAALACEEMASGTQPITQVIPGMARPQEVPFEPPPLPAPPRVIAALLGRRWRLALAAVAAAVVLVVGLLFGISRGTEIPDPTPSPERQRQLAYLALLTEVQQLYSSGDHAAAERRIAEAETHFPEARRIRELRHEAWWQRETERVTLRVARAIELLDVASAALARADLATADATLVKLWQLDPGNREARSLRARLAGARERARRAAAPPPPPPPEPEAEPAAAFEPFVVRQVPAAPAADPFGRLQIDFQSQLPRGVVTVYANGDQILNRDYQFFERRGLLRKRRAVTGGFDTEQRLAAGALELRVYLSGPGRPGRLETLGVELPGGTVRTLTIRVDKRGELELGFH